MRNTIGVAAVRELDFRPIFGQARKRVKTIGNGSKQPNILIILGDDIGRFRWKEEEGWDPVIESRALH